MRDVQTVKIDCFHQFWVCVALTLANAGKVMLIKLIIVLLATIIVLRLLNFYSAYPLLCSLFDLRSAFAFLS
jgi:hypothetical protein